MNVINEKKRNCYIIVNDFSKKNQEPYKNPVNAKRKSVTPVAKFLCIRKNDCNTFNTLQGIEYSNGKCAVGIDVWRDLDKHDCSSHQITEYRKDEVTKIYNLVSKKNY